MNDLSPEFYLSLGQKLKEVRRKAGLRQPTVAREMGYKPSTGQVFISRLEHGRAASVTLATVVRYLQACKAPVGKFMLELAQAGSFGEAEQGLTVAVGPSSSLKLKQEMRARARHERSAARAAEDADIIARLWREVLPAIQPLLPRDPTVFLSHYLEGVRTFYRAWRQTVRGVLNRDPTLDVQMAFDRVEQAGVQRLVPAAVRKMREIVYTRLMAATPSGGNT